MNATWGNPTYIFCTSLPGVEISHLKSTYGEYVVKINDLEQFMRDMKKALLNTDHKFIGKDDVQGKIVEYSKGDVLPKDLGGFASCELAYVQKASEFKPDCEFRFVAMMNITNPPDEMPEYVELNFGKKLEYAKLC